MEESTNSNPEQCPTPPKTASKAKKFITGKLSHYWVALPFIVIIYLVWESIKKHFAPKAGSFDLGDFDGIIVMLLFALFIFLYLVGFLRINFPRSLYQYFITPEKPSITDDFCNIEPWQRLKLFFIAVGVLFFLLIRLLELTMGSKDSFLQSLGVS